MNHLTKEDVREVVKEIVDEAIDRHSTSSHHDFVQMLKDDHDKRKERVEKIKTQVIGWSIIASLGVIGTVVADTAKTIIEQWIRHWR